MNKLEISKELLKNTTSSYLREFIKIYIGNMKDIEQRKPYIEQPYIRFDNCVSYIEQVQFNITGWELMEIPIFYSHRFCNEKTNQYFDLAVWDIDEVIPRYILHGNEEDATSIQDAIEKYHFD